MWTRRHFNGISGKLPLFLTAAATIVVVGFLASRAGWFTRQFSTEEGAHFDVPENVLPLQQAEFKTSPEAITICNRSAERWSNLVIQITGVGAVYTASVPPQPPTYVAELPRLEGGKCKEIPIESFVDSSPKRLRAFRGLEVTKVEVLADVPRKSYATQRF